MTTSASLDGSPDPRSFTSAIEWIGGLQTLREHARLCRS
ncbi:MAG: hypothetical protein QG608_2344 [Actinomycetota bacterium]|nr:hypothetical protein [Actinomycetota bacterium]